VIGQQPVLSPGQNFRYTSACPLFAPSGVMMGSYQMVRTADGSAFDIAVPAFSLDSPHQTKRVN
jgi:ApaG protein